MADRSLDLAGATAAGLAVYAAMSGVPLVAGVGTFIAVLFLFGRIGALQK